MSSRRNSWRPTSTTSVKTRPTPYGCAHTRTSLRYTTTSKSADAVTFRRGAGQKGPALFFFCADSGKRHAFLYARFVYSIRAANDVLFVIRATKKGKHDAEISRLGLDAAHCERAPLWTRAAATGWRSSFSGSAAQLHQHERLVSSGQPGGLGRRDAELSAHHRRPSVERPTGRRRDA